MFILSHYALSWTNFKENEKSHFKRQKWANVNNGKFENAKSHNEHEKTNVMQPKKINVCAQLGLLDEFKMIKMIHACQGRWSM